MGNIEFVVIALYLSIPIKNKLLRNYNTGVRSGIGTCCSKKHGLTQMDLLDFVNLSDENMFVLDYILDIPVTCVHLIYILTYRLYFIFE